ncbi:MAG: peptide-binding protein [Candidatus Omnitrophica bacterium]|nr:peptide-binding protein [Candidatus Omnitrophota bacterium]
MKRKLLIVFYFISMFSGQSVYSGDISEFRQNPDYGDTIIDCLSGQPSILIPMLASDSASHGVAGLIFNGLVKYDTDLTLTGDLAESWVVSEDGLEITFNLRKGVKWHDGVEFTADDVMFGYETIINENTLTAYKEDYLQVKKAEVIDKYTFRVNYEKPFAPALSTWGSLVVLPKHLLEGKDIAKVDFARNPIGMGPFKFSKWVAGQEVVLTSNHNYFDGRPYLDRYIYRIIPDSATRFMELKAGGVDQMGLSALQYRKQTTTSYFKENFQKFKYPTFNYTYMGFNLKHPWFKDKRVRQAIGYAIDKKEIIKGVLFGLGNPATGPYVPNTWPYNPDVKKYNYNPEKAKRLLKEAGWEDTNGDGLLDKDGNPFEFTILTNMGNSYRIKTASIIQWRLKKIGIKVNIRILEWSSFINEFIDKKRFEVVLLGWSIGLDPDQYDIWHSSKTKEKEFNFISYKNEEVDFLLEKGRRTFDIEERKKYYFKLQEILAEDAPYIFLYVPDSLPIIHSRFKGIKPEPIGIGYNIHKWYVPAGLQRHKFKE